MLNKISCLLLFLSLSAGLHAQPKKVPANKLLKFSQAKLEKSLAGLTDTTRFPRNVKPGESKWGTTRNTDWTSGFFPGELWYMYGYNHKKSWEKQARRWTAGLEPIKDVKWTHDLGFMMFNSYGLGYKFTKDPKYKDIVLQTAASLATLYNPKVGLTRSWGWRKEWMFPVIIDNMMNLELLFWASKNGGKKEWYDMALSHAEKTLKNHIRPDYTTYHVVNYDSVTGKVLHQVTDQGYSNQSTWARGQAWSVYGFTMVYRETKDQRFLDAAQKLADVFIKNLPADFVPYWDFNAPNIPNEERDASAAAVAASGLLELSSHVKDKAAKQKYKQAAVNILNALGSDAYLTTNSDNPAILKHSVGSKPHKSEIDVSIVYADYYFIEALLRYKCMK